MWHHTKAEHGGIIGDEGGIMDYRFKILYTFWKNLSRQVEEGIRQTDQELAEEQGTLIAMNSKIDFIKPLKISMKTYCGYQKAKPNNQLLA